LNTDQYESAFDIVVHLVDALTLLAVVEALLGNVEKVFDLGERSFQTTLALGQRLNLRGHLVHLVLCLVLPKRDVTDALA